MKDKLPLPLWLMLWSAILGVFISKLFVNLVNVALPVIAGEFQVSPTRVSWVMLAYLLLSTSLMLLSGKLEDRYGLRKVFLLGCLVFSLGALLGGFAPGFYWLIPGVALQGIGSAMLVTAAFALIPRYMPPERTPWAFGLLSACSALGVALGSPLGGLIAGCFSWRWVFFFVIPLGLAAFILARKTLPEKPASASSGSPDWLGGALSLGFLALLVFALSLGRELSWGSPLILGSLLLSLVLGLIFFLVERAKPDPVFDFKLLKIPAFAFGSLASLFTMSFMAGSMFLLPFYLRDFRGISLQHIGLILMIPSGIYVGILLLLSRYLNRFTSRWPCVIAMLGMGGSSLYFALTLAKGGLSETIVFLALYGVFLSFFIAPNNNMVMCSLPSEREGEGSGLFQTLNSLGLVAGVCIFQAAFTAFFPPELLDEGLATIPRELLSRGFAQAYIWGGAVCFVSAGLSFLGVNRKN